jgi:DNA-binding beta-propeller fold protein YncE
MLRRSAVAVVLSLTCLGCNCDSSEPPDGGANDAGALDAGGVDAGGADAGEVDAGGSDAGALDAGQPDDGLQRAYAIVVTQSPAGPGNGSQSTWGGVLQFELPRDGGAFQQIAGIDAGLVHDPVALLYRAATRELFVANRHGNNSADGVAGSISVFVYSPATRDFRPSAEIVGNGLSGVHQLALSPMTGELFAANVNSGISRFLFVDGGAVPNGTISSGPVRGVLISADGTRLFHTSASNVIRQFPVDGGAELTPLVLPGSPNLHFFDLHGDTVYVCGLDSQLIYRLADVDGGLALVDSFPANSPISVRVDLTGQELWASGHRSSDVFERFELDAGQWSLQVEYPTTTSLGGIELLP